MSSMCLSSCWFSFLVLWMSPVVFRVYRPIVDWEDLSKSIDESDLQMNRIDVHASLPESSKHSNTNVRHCVWDRPEVCSLLRWSISFRWQLNVDCRSSRCWSPRPVELFDELTWRYSEHRHEWFDRVQLEFLELILCRETYPRNGN